MTHAAWRTLTLSGIALALAACGGTGVDSPSTKTKTNPDTPEVILDLINQARSVPRTCGGTAYPAAPPLRWSTELAQASVAHSQDMADRNYMEHAAKAPAPYGVSMGERAKHFGWQSSGYMAENISAGRASAQDAIQGWLKSPGHCRNLMNTSATHVGMGYGFHQQSQYGHYWTQMFAKQ